MNTTAAHLPPEQFTLESLRRFRSEFPPPPQYYFVELTSQPQTIERYQLPAALDWKSADLPRPNCLVCTSETFDALFHHLRGDFAGHRFFNAIAGIEYINATPEYCAALTLKIKTCLETLARGGRTA